LADTLVLDTNAFNERGLAHWLRAYPGRKVLPAVAAAELYYHLRVQRRWPMPRFLAFLREAGVTIEPLDANRALAAVEAAGSGFPDRSADALIGAHALSPGRVLVTRDFSGHPDVPRKLTPAQLLRA
jgi:predicted nucleic acid-binding protein